MAMKPTSKSGGGNDSGANGTSNTGTTGSSLGPAGCWITHKGLETWAKIAKDRNTKSSPKRSNKEEFNVAKAEHTVQPPSTLPSHPLTPRLPFNHGRSTGRGYGGCGHRSPLESLSPVLTHQSRSYPSGQPSRLARTSSVSSQGSLDSAPRQTARGSSPQIRTFAPDGTNLFQYTNTTSTTSNTPEFGLPPPPSASRSPSPASSYRAASLDIRSSSPSLTTSTSDLRTLSPSQSSLTSLTDRSSVCNSPGIPSPRGPGSIGRCLSPLLIPSSSRLAHSDPGLQPPASPLGAIQPDLYQRREGPLFLEASRVGPTLGRLHLRLNYDFDRSDLHIHIIEAHDLAGSEQGGFNDPYIKLSLEEPVDSRKRETSIHRNDPNPFFDEHFKFPVSYDELQERTLLLQVFDYDRYSRNDVIGEVRMVMREFDVTSNVEIWGEITRNRKPPEQLQEVLLSLSYLPQAERLTVVLMKARNLFVRDEKGNIDPFVKVYLLTEGKRVKKKKTCSRKGCCNPVWNEALNYRVTAANFPNSGIEVCVLDQGTDLIGKDPLLGCCVIGPTEEGAARDHWSDMAESPRKAVTMWHTLH